MDDETPDPIPQPARSRIYRPQDERLYLVFAGYCVATFLLVKLSYGSIGGYLFIGFALPLVALLALVCFQIATRRRVSPLAFGLVFAGILGVGYGVLWIAAEATAAV